MLDTQGHCINVRPSALGGLNLQTCNPFVHNQKIYSLRYIKENVSPEQTQTSSVYKCVSLDREQIRYTDYVNVTHLLTIRMRKDESIE